MNLYLLTQTVNLGYDTYDSCVVAAKSEDDAKAIHPSGYDNHWTGSNSCWAFQPEQVNVKLIGKTSFYKEAQLVLASFNAG